MAIEFVNINSGERRVLSDPHQIGAFINSSDLHVNSNLGQDFGWRLAPGVVHRMDMMRLDVEKLEGIARRVGISVEDITNIHLVNQISYEDAMAEQARQVRRDGQPEYKDQYEAELAALRGRVAPKEALVPTSYEESSTITPAEVEAVEPKKDAKAQKVTVKDETPKEAPVTVHNKSTKSNKK